MLLRAQTCWTTRLITTLSLLNIRVIGIVSDAHMTHRRIDAIMGADGEGWVLEDPVTGADIARGRCGIVSVALRTRTCHIHLFTLIQRYCWPVNPYPHLRIYSTRSKATGTISSSPA